MQGIYFVVEFIEGDDTKYKIMKECKKKLIVGFYGFS